MRYEGFEIRKEVSDFLGERKVESSQLLSSLFGSQNF